MTTNPTFIAPSGGPADATTDPSPFIEVDKALESMRDAGFDVTVATGEPIDNSIQAGATTIRIKTTYSQDKKKITELAFADDGRGIDPSVMRQVLRMGFSTRYGQRDGLGRFGVGLKLAGISVGRRIEVITKPVGSDVLYRVFIDLDMITDGSQASMEVAELDSWPAEYQDLLTDSQGNAFTNGTLVVWQKIDRLSSGGTYGTSLEAKMQDILKYIARTYREFLDRGLVIELDGRKVGLHDPLFLLDNPRIDKKYKGRKVDPILLEGTVIDETELTIDGHPVQVTVSIAPEYFRHKKGTGGEKDADGIDISEFQINQDNEGRISMMRNGREVYYDIIPRILPSGVTVGDRYIGIEVSFPAELDGYFQVRNVKHGAVPVGKLREEIRKWLQRTVIQARKQIRTHWKEVEIQDAANSDDGRPAEIMEAVERSEEKAPQGRAGLGMSEEIENEKIDEIIETLDLDEDDDAEAIQRIRQQIKEKPITILDGKWKGKELMSIEHLNGKAVLELNHFHPFIRDIYDALRTSSSTMPEEQDPADLHDLIRRTSLALDMLFIAYAKAENLHPDPEIFDDLRTYWGLHTQAYMRELEKEEA